MHANVEELLTHETVAVDTPFGTTALCDILVTAKFRNHFTYLLTYLLI